MSKLTKVLQTTFV